MSMNRRYGRNVATKDLSREFEHPPPFVAASKTTQSPGESCSKCILIGALDTGTGPWTTEICQHLQYGALPMASEATAT